MQAINLIKEKKSSMLKGCTCADGRLQQTMYMKEETASLTIATDALMLSLMIDAIKKYDVATTDVVGTYLNAEMLDIVLLKLTGETVNIMCCVNLRYSAFVVEENGQQVLYLKLLKALYSCIKSALLWYKLFFGNSRKNGFCVKSIWPMHHKQDGQW